jgi:hypothetical protein
MKYSVFFLDSSRVDVDAPNELEARDKGKKHYHEIQERAGEPFSAITRTVNLKTGKEYYG